MVLTINIQYLSMLVNWVYKYWVVLQAKQVFMDIMLVEFG
jgi:hypothetical protein